MLRRWGDGPVAPGRRRDPLRTTRLLELIADLFNALNLFDRNWGVQRQYPASQLLSLAGYDQTSGRGIYDVLRIDRNVRDNEATRWRLQLGVRYTF